MTDIRTVKTVNAIRNAFTEMIIKNDKVFFSIKDIADRAGINRKTFYLHFECIEDLYADLEKITEDKLIEVMNQNGFFEENFTLEVCLKSILELVNSNVPLYEKLLLADNYKFLFRNIKNKIKVKIMNLMKAENGLKTELYSEFLCSGLLKLFRVWASRKDEMSEDEMIKCAYAIMKYGLRGIQGLN